MKLDLLLELATPIDLIPQTLYQWLKDSIFVKKYDAFESRFKEVEINKRPDPRIKQQIMQM